MSQHPSLSSSTKGKRHRSVLKRFERLKILEEKGEWEEGSSIFGLPKVKTLRIKVKKGKASEAPEAVAAQEGAEIPEEGVAKEEVTPKKEDTKSKKEESSTKK